MDLTCNIPAPRCSGGGGEVYDGKKIKGSKLNPPKKNRDFFYEKKKLKNCTTCKVIAYSASVLDFNSVQAL